MQLIIDLWDFYTQDPYIADKKKKKPKVVLIDTCSKITSIDTKDIINNVYMYLHVSSYMYQLKYKVLSKEAYEIY